jgi:hypothetical protein
MTLKGLGVIEEAGAGVASIAESYLWFCYYFFWIFLVISYNFSEIFCK